MLLIIVTIAAIVITNCPSTCYGRYETARSHKSVRISVEVLLENDMQTVLASIPATNL